VCNARVSQYLTVEVELRRIPGREPRGSAQEPIEDVSMPRLARARPELAVERIAVEGLLCHLTRIHSRAQHSRRGPGYRSTPGHIRGAAHSHCIDTDHDGRSTPRCQGRAREVPALGRRPREPRRGAAAPRGHAWHPGHQRLHEGPARKRASPRLNNAHIGWRRAGSGCVWCALCSIFRPL
jgi:hypothetical protein